MDIALLRTFLELHRTRHFGQAAKRLFLTQSAVSARLRQLEETLGVTLFTRDRNNVHLTPAGMRFLKHAENIVNAWNRAKQETALEDESKIMLSISGVYSLWDTGLQESIHKLHRADQNLALQIEANNQSDLVRQLLEGTIDLGFMFEPPKMAELVTVEFGKIELIMVSSQPDLTAAEALSLPNYIMVDWGTTFALSHARQFPDMPAPSIRMGLGRLALAFILDCGGTAYLARQMVTDHLKKKKLYVVDGADTIVRDFYAAYAHGTARRDVVENALQRLKS